MHVRAITVAELVELLRRCPQDAKVRAESRGSDIFDVFGVDARADQLVLVSCARIEGAQGEADICGESYELPPRLTSSAARG